MADNDADEEDAGAAPEPESEDQAAPDNENNETDENGSDPESESDDAESVADTNEDIDSSTDSDSSDGGYQVYDFSHPQHRLGEKIPQLRNAGNELASSVNRYVDNWLHINARIELADASAVKYQYYVKNIEENSCLFDYKISGIPAVALMSFDYGLILKIVEKYFGGKSSAADAPLRGFSTTETRLAIRLRKCIVAGLNEVWNKLFTISNTNNGILNRNTVLVAESESSVVAVMNFTVTIDEENSGISITLPWAALSQIKRSSVFEDESRAGDDGSWRRKIGEKLSHCEVDLYGQLAESRVTVEHLLKMQPGDFIPLGDQHSAVFMVEGIPVFNAMIGSNKSQVSARFLNWIEQGEHST